MSKRTPGDCPFPSMTPLNAPPGKRSVPHAVHFKWGGDWYLYKIHRNVGHSKNALLNAADNVKGVSRWGTCRDVEVRIVNLDNNQPVWQGMLSSVEQGKW